MKKILLYHGSDHIIKEPIYNYPYSNPNNDYGKAFYCTIEKEAGKEWACKQSHNGVLNIYELNPSGLNIIDLTDKSKYNVLNWIALLNKNRNLSPAFKEQYSKQLKYLSKYDIDFSNCDIIIGFRADDAYFKFPKMFITNSLTLSRLEEIYLNGNLGKQVAVKSKKGYEALTFLNCEEVGEEYYYKYQSRVNIANQIYNQIEQEEMMLNGDKILDLMKEEI